MSVFVCNCFYFGKGVGVRNGDMERTYSEIYFMVQEYIRVGPLGDWTMYLFHGYLYELNVEVQCFHEAEIHYDVVLSMHFICNAHIHNFLFFPVFS